MPDAVQILLRLVGEAGIIDVQYVVDHSLCKAIDLSLLK